MEKWEEYYTREQLAQLQNLELKMLKTLTKICAQLEIDFFMYGGSLIGTVRHGGFVPWDDDLDVAMLRSDYEIFVKKAPNLLSDEYYLQSPYQDKKSPYFYTKLRLKNTKCIEYGHHRLDIEKGIYVDIYPIDSLPNDNKKYIANFKKYQYWIRVFVLRQCPYCSYKATTLLKKIKYCRRRLLSAILHLIPHSFLVNKLDRIMKTYNNEGSERYGNYSFPRPCNYFDSVYPLQKRSFCGVDVNIPQSWESHLIRRYGDYMNMPPINERVGHMPYEFDLGIYK